MAYVKTNRIFVYGDFVLSKKRLTVSPPPTGGQPFAIEILREFSSTEFVGKLYVRAGSSWLAATRSMLHEHTWYKFAAMSDASRFIQFHMEGSGFWRVENLRDESDDSGPYVAVALKFESA
jgi:hypothetical protein